LSSSSPSSSTYSRPSYAPPFTSTRSDWSTGQDATQADATRADARSAPGSVGVPGGSGNYGGPAGASGAAGASFSPAAAGAVGGAASGAASGLSGYASSVATAWQNRSSKSDSKWKQGAAVRRPAKRQAMLTLARVEPWSVMKFSFLASVVAFIILFVAVAVLYMSLSALGVFDSIQHTVSSITSGQNSNSGTNISHYFSASLILGYTAMLGALNIVLITAMSTVGSVIYNLIAKTVGGIEVTLRETD
jgi:Transmembrane domain of unknown function (DUF3566)